MRHQAAGVGVALLALIGCASTSGSASGGPTSDRTFGRRDERQFIGSFADVRAVAVSRRYVYSATPSGIGIYDRLSNLWLPPLSRDNGFTDYQVTAFAGDPVEDAVWFGVPGAVVSYRPQVEQVQRTIIVGVPDAIVFESSLSGDVLVRAGGAWTRVSRTGLASPMVNAPTASTLRLPPSLSDLYAQFPQLRTPQGMLAREQRADRTVRQYPVVSGAVSPERASEVWLGTSGDGLYRVDPSFQQLTPLHFGPLESAVGALALASDGVWMAGMGSSFARAGLSFATDNLQRWRWIDGTIAVPLLGVRAYALRIREQRAWMATDRGVARVRLDADERVSVWSTLDGLPDDRVFAVAPVDDGAWVGTARGLVWVSDSSDARDRRTRGIGTRLLDNTAVFALEAIGDTLWVGTSAGLLALPGSRASTRLASVGLARPVGTDPALRRPIRSLAWSDSVLLAATDDGVLRVTPRRPSEPVRVPELDARLVGQVSRVLIDDRTMWLAGTDGVLLVSRRGGATRMLRVPFDIPAPVTDLVASRDWLWIGTPLGVVRLQRAADGGVR